MYIVGVFATVHGTYEEGCYLNLEKKKRKTGRKKGGRVCYNHTIAHIIRRYVNMNNNKNMFENKVGSLIQHRSL